MRISNQQALVEPYQSQGSFQDAEIILTYPAGRHNSVRKDYIIEQAPLFTGMVATARNTNTYSANNGTVSLRRNVVGTLMDVYA